MRLAPSHTQRDRYPSDQSLPIRGQYSGHVVSVDQSEARHGTLWGPGHLGPGAPQHGSGLPVTVWGNGQAGEDLS